MLRNSYACMDGACRSAQRAGAIWCCLAYVYPNGPVPYYAVDITGRAATTGRATAAMEADGDQHVF
jgi:hypothetical protein